jgi:hypothetical protein
VQHCIKFFGSFASKAPENSEVATAVLEDLLEHLARYSAAADKEVRFHACQLLHQLLVQIRASVLSDDTVLDTLTDALTRRLSDKLPAIRGEAVKGLCTLISFFEVGHPQLQLLLGCGTCRHSGSSLTPPHAACTTVKQLHFRLHTILLLEVVRCCSEIGSAPASHSDATSTLISAMLDILRIV